MDKYAGIERANGEVYASTAVKRRKTKSKPIGTLMRWTVAALVCGVAFLGTKTDNAVMRRVSDAMQDIVCYDMLNQEDLGEIPSVDAFIESQEKDG